MCLLFRPIVVLRLGTTIVVTDVSLGAQMLCGCFICFGSQCYRTNACVMGVVSLKPKCYKADLFVVVHGVENQHACDRCCITKKPGCYLAEWAVMKNTLGSQAEHLQKDTKNTQKPHHPTMTIITPLVVIYLLTIFALWAGKIRIWKDPSKKPFSSQLMTHSLIGT